MSVPDLRLELTFDAPDSAQFGLSGTPTLTIAATLVDLAVLYDLAARAREYGVPIVNLLDAVRQVPTSDAGAQEPPQDLAAYQWSAARLLPLNGPAVPQFDANEFARVQEHLILYRPRAFLRLQGVAFNRPLRCSFHIFGREVEATRSLWIFLGAVEALFRAPGHVDATDAMEAFNYPDLERNDQAAAAIALRGVELFSTDTADVALQSGRLVLATA